MILIIFCEEEGDEGNNDKMLMGFRCLPASYMFSPTCHALGHCDLTGAFKNTFRLGFARISIFALLQAADVPCHHSCIISGSHYALLVKHIFPRLVCVHFSSRVVIFSPRNPPLSQSSLPTTWP